MAAELPAVPEPTGEDLRVEPPTIANGGVGLFLAAYCFIYMNESNSGTLLARLLLLLALWRAAFPQARSHRRATRQALGGLVCLGRRTLSRVIWTNGDQNRSWGADYLLQARCRWEPQPLFRPILEQALEYCPGRLVGVSVNETQLRKTGRCIPQAFYQRDPLSPPFHCNLLLGLRFLQASLLVPTYWQAPVNCRALPLRFQEVSVVKRPRRNSSEQLWEQYQLARKRHNLSQAFVAMTGDLRRALDQAGGKSQLLVVAADGSFCNRTCLTP